MRPRDRVQVFFVGVVLGSLLVGLLMARKAAQRERDGGPPAVILDAEGRELPPLPDGVPEALKAGAVLAHGFLPPAPEPAMEEVWIAGFDDRYPYVRVVRRVADGELSYMAADQVVVEMREGVDVTAMEPLLDELGLQVRMFNRRHRLLVVGVVAVDLDSVPATIAALAPAADLYREVRPDTIVFRE